MNWFRRDDEHIVKVISALESGKRISKNGSENLIIYLRSRGFIIEQIKSVYADAVEGFMKRKYEKKSYELARNVEKMFHLEPGTIPNISHFSTYPEKPREFVVEEELFDFVNKAVIHAEEIMKKWYKEEYNAELDMLLAQGEKYFK